MEPIPLNTIAQLLHCKTQSESLVTGVSVDSRTIKSGDLFFALPGERVDGHQYLEGMASKGVVGAVVSKNYKGPDFGLALLPVEDTLKTLQEWARQVIAQRCVRVVAITGSVGKTTTKEFVKALLSKKYRVASSPGNSNSQIGIPLAILNHTKGNEEILILEMGMTVPGNLARLVQIAPPEVAVITNVALVHACNFDSLEAIARAKAEILSSPHTRVGVLPREIVNYELINKTTTCRKISFSTVNPDTDYYLDPNHPTVLEAFKDEKQVKMVPLPIPGKHNWHNLLAAITVARHFKVSWRDIIDAITTLQLPERRLNFVKHKDICFLNDAYNASELSVKGALETLPAPEKGGAKIAVLGSMMELGKFSVDCHTRVGEFALNHVDAAYCLGVECQPIYEAFKKAGKPAELFLDRAKLIEHLRTILKPKDVVLLKGSNSKQLWKVLEEL